jgi:RNA polymerase sigma factor (sigma-70 family)
MSSESASQALRQIRTLHALGAVGGMTDPQLVERFLEHDGCDREDAFTALVQRHGPMVRRVCRRMLWGSADADDAFQAVFLVLARKAGAVRRVERLKPWLYAVAVRTAKEARRRAARRQAREGGTMDESKAMSKPDPGKSELVSLVDEEISRLPSRYREAVLLCELEGVSRQDAARQLGLPEGTLSSRLARGRTLLRSRLTRRGVVLGAGLIATLIPEPATAALPEPLAESTVHLALKFAAGGAPAGVVPTAVSSLAERVLEMLSVAKVKLILLATVTLGGAACLTAGLAWAIASKRGGQPAATPPAAAIAGAPREESTKKGPPRPARVHGVVVDEAGRPVAGALVQADPFTPREARGTTGADGWFSIEIPRHQIDGMAILARSAEGNRLGYFQYDYNLTVLAAQSPARLVLKPGREVVVRVTSSSRAPVPDAAVEAAGNFAVLADGKTGPDGSARLIIPAEGKVQCVFALKSGVGFDYAEYGQIDGKSRSQGGAPAASLPGSIELALDGVRTARIRAVDRDGKPISGAAFHVWLVHKEGRRTEVNIPSRVLAVTTAADGVANFDWLPPSKDLLQFWPIDDRYAQRRVVVEQGQTTPVSTRLIRTEVIRGRVTRPDGAPAPGIQIRAYGSGQGIDNGQGRALTADDGSYEMSLGPSEAYAVYVDDKDWAAPSRLDVVVREGKPVEGVDFKLARGTILRGTVTVGAAGRIVPSQYIWVDESGAEAPDEFRAPGDRYAHQVLRQFGVMTDAVGRYSIRVGPGTYTLMGPPRTTNEKITVKDEAEIVRDFRMPRPEKGSLTGRVVQTGARDMGVAGAMVEGIAANSSAATFAATSDAEGRFKTERSLDPLVIFAKSPDGSLGAIVEVGAEDPEVVIALSPTATATGLLLDEQGKPAANQQLYWGRRVYLDEDKRVSTECFAPKVETDKAGKFSLASLVVGQEYKISVQRENKYLMAGVVKPEKPGPIDLGTLKVGAYHEQSAADATEMSSFRRDAPGAGAVATDFEATSLEGKPLRLSDFKGRYVLLDFWATWCGPCIKEIPTLQAIQDAFGKDGRFAIVGLSVDDKID